MDLATLRALVIENVGHRIHPPTNQINRLINRSVEHLTNHVEQTHKWWNMADTNISVSVVSGTQTYTISSSTIKIRKILHAERTDINEDRPIDVTIIPYANKNLFGSVGPYAGGSQGSFRPTIMIRRTSGGNWDVIFPYDPQTTMTLSIAYAPRITELATDTSEPTEVPEHHHELIAIRATVVLLQQFERKTDVWERQYAELLQLMREDLESLNRTGPKVRQVYVSRV